MNAAWARAHRPFSNGPVVDLTCWRIERALARRSRYKYVTPRIEAEGTGWRIVSPNCSRNIDPAGGDIAIAWFEPGDDGLWSLHARDRHALCWRLMESGLTLDVALQRVCDDELRKFWP
jgi:hypothetical protein